MIKLPAASPDKITRVPLLLSTATLITGVPALPPQGREGIQGAGRSHVGYALRSNNAALCQNGSGAGLAISTHRA